MTPAHDRPRAGGDVALYVRLIRDSRRYWPHIGAVFVVDLMAMPLALLAPVPFALVIDSVLGGQPAGGPLAGLSGTGLLVFAALLLVAVVGLAQLQSLGSLLMTTWAAERLTLDFRSRVFRHLQRLSFPYHDITGTADSVYRVQYDAPAISYVAVYGVAPFVTAIVTLLAMVYVTAQISADLAIIALAVSPFIYVLVRWSRRVARPQWRQVKKLESSSMSVVEEVLSNLRVVKGFGQEEREQKRFVDASSSSLNARIRVTGIDGLTSSSVALTIAVGTALVLFVGALQVQADLITLGQLTLVVGYMSQLYAPLKSMSSSVSALQGSLASGERAYAVLDQLPDVEDRPHAMGIERARGDVRFDHVRFAYRGDVDVLRDITLDVPQGAKVGIQGVTGSGKTTLISLLMRFYDPSAGRILLDGTDLRDYRVDDLRAQFSLVLQEPVLFARSIGENISYARPEASFDEIVRAARLANADGFIRSMPDGYDSMVGERGMTLSGGERQRISLARAFLRDAPLLVMDEPTSSIDVQTESLIVDAMGRLMEGRTTFMIAHRLSTLASCDIRIELTNGTLQPASPDTSALGRRMTTDSTALDSAAVVVL